MNEVQQTILSIFKTVKEICERNNLTYYAIGGTCIGAVRHKGFIPWDDDMDIAVPIEEWDRFWECMSRELPENYKIYRCEDIKHYRYVFNKIHDIDTTFIEEAETKYPDAYKGIFLDIMPIAGIPKDKREREKYYSTIRKLSIFNYIRRYPFKEMESFKRKILWIMLRTISPFVTYRFFSDKWMCLLVQHPMKDSEYTGYTWWDTITDNLCFPICQFSRTELLPFEDTEIACPVDWDGYLSHQFGDYMRLPPEEERMDHHQIAVSTSKSYTEYKGELS